MSAVYISIGNACNMNYQINKHIGKKETLFFDNLLICVDSVISILSSFENIDKILYFENVIQKPYDSTFNGVKSKMIIKSLPFCEFIHDVKIGFTNEDILEFIEKYKRRFLLNKEADSIRKEENFLEINIKKPDIPYEHEWTTSYLDWKKIFTDIENNT
jgi:hypothetical protein